MFRTPRTRVSRDCLEDISVSPCSSWEAKEEDGIRGWSADEGEQEIGEAREGGGWRGKRGRRKGERGREGGEGGRREGERGKGGGMRERERGREG